jgi:competence protein ComEA
MKNLTKIILPFFIIILSIIGIIIYEKGKEESMDIIEKIQIPENKEVKKIAVQVEGAVKNPGVYIITENTHLYELLLIAEPLPDANMQKISLVELLKDGRHIKIPFLVNKNNNILSNQPVNNTNIKVHINKAGINELILIPGIGESYAKRIIEYRQSHGFFKEISDLLNVKGIGPAKLKNMETYITLE